MSQNPSTLDLLAQLLTTDYGGIQRKRDALLQIMQEPKRIEEARQALEGAL
jgi:hypothetical protein